MRNGAGTKTKVAIAGLGAIGAEVARALDRGIDGLELAAVSAANIDKHRPWLDKLQMRPAALPIEALAEAADIVIGSRAQMFAIPVAKTIFSVWDARYAE